ncbi:MAG: tRNA uridine-5-carboxymethylaminomethyl(34) synthesis GTPase MnmE [Pseudomonadota bacterium]
MVHHQKNRERAREGPRQEVAGAQRDTIAAVATAVGRGALGIVRLSGPCALEIAEQLAGPLPTPRSAVLRHFNDETGAAIDQGLVLVFKAPHSFTGEDVVELQGHGAPVVLAALVSAAIAHGARAARPGEFSERAYLNGRIDLAQAEAIADLIDAASTQAARAAQRSLDGEFSARVRALTESLIALRVYVEGALDFSDEDIDWLGQGSLHARIAQWLLDLDALMQQAAQGRRLREGLTIALTGRPNAGKSTLLNRLAGSEAAIVSPTPGTTRDVLRENILLDSMPLTLVDTAGLRDSDDPIEREGVRRAKEAVHKAELVLFLADGRDVDANGRLDAEDQILLDAMPSGLPRLILLNKCDLTEQAPGSWQHAGEQGFRLSAATGAGIESLLQALRQHCGLADSHEGVFIARSRHLAALHSARVAVGTAQARLQEGAHAELAAEELRRAQQALDEITGPFAADDLLGRVFSQFCIGK